MDQSLVNRLIKNFPEMYRPDEYLGVGDGWYSILWNLSQEVMDLCRERGEVPPKVLQVKEKFGALRIYFEYFVGDMGEIVSKYERESLNICERCGKPGSTKGSTGWIKTLCTECRGI